MTKLKFTLVTWSAKIQPNWRNCEKQSKLNKNCQRNHVSCRFFKFYSIWAESEHSNSNMMMNSYARTLNEIQIFVQKLYSKALSCKAFCSRKKTVYLKNPILVKLQKAFAKSTYNLLNFYDMRIFDENSQKILVSARLRLKNCIQAFLDFRGFNFRGFQFTAVYNSILFSSSSSSPNKSLQKTRKSL